MQYHIQTDPIWEAFGSDCDCPLCEIYSKCEARLIEQYLNEAVMSPEYRVEVNKYGFCSEHLRKLFAGKNKLGLALQLHTRGQEMRSEMKPCKSHKQAVKLADYIDENTCSCVICRSLDDMMNRYAYTTAQMFANEGEFRTVLSKSGGFCLPHFSLLLRYANKAGKFTESYLSELTYLQNRSFDRTLSELDRFTQKFDYRNAGSSVKPDPDTVPSAIRKFKGRIV